MEIEVNGQPHELADGSSLAELLSALGLAGKRVAVECNGALVPRGLQAEHRLVDGDRVEIVQAIGGG